MPEKNYLWLLFDADGTLFDYEYAEESAIKSTFIQLGNEYKPLYLEIYKQINSQLWKDYELGLVKQDELKTIRFVRLLESINIDKDPYLFSIKYLENLSKSSRLLNGAEEICKTLAQVYNLAIITNGLKDVQRPRFSNSAIFPYFKEIFISEEISAAKPDREYFDTVFSKIGNPEKSKVLVIGDSLSSDIKGGLNYGVDTCWFNSSKSVPDPGINPGYVIHSLNELLLFL